MCRNIRTLLQFRAAGDRREARGRPQFVRKISRFAKPSAANQKALTGRSMRSRKLPRAPSAHSTSASPGTVRPRPPGPTPVPSGSSGP
jgi:hypothetical protein